MTHFVEIGDRRYYLQREESSDGLPRYRVLMDKETMGFVGQKRVLKSRVPKGRNIATKIWETKRWFWSSTPRPGRNGEFETRTAAVRALLDA